MRPSKSTLGDCNIKGKVALDLSINSFRDAERNSNSEVSCRQHRDIPDLNEEFHQKTAMTHGKQLSAFFEKRSLPLHKTLVRIALFSIGVFLWFSQQNDIKFFHDVSASSSKEKARESKKQLGVAKPQNKDSHMELGASDDIPMEIVELLAKNQHERALGNSRRHINNSPRGYGALYVDGHPDVVNFPPVNRRNGLTVANRNMGFGQNNISANFPPLNNCQLDMRKPEESQFRLFTSSTPGQHRKTQFQASSSIMTGARNSAGAEILWSPTRENAPPFRFSIPQNHSSQQNSMGVNLFSDQRNKGKIICNIKDNQDKRAVHKKGRIVSGSTSLGSLDPYSNDTIPAMQLLSLMDQQVVSGSSFELGTKRFLDKPISPCTHQARLNGKENHKFLGGSFFPQNNHSKDFSGFRFGAYSSAESSKKVSSYLQGQVPLELRNSKTNPLKGSSNLAIRSAKSNSALGVCTLNRNPADFSFPDARNEFTISAKDLKPRKRNVSKEKSRLVNGEGRKRQRMKKDATGKECSRK
ncbi:hypothetical protein DH2020_001685 [Rehmannia glutinosa]|uniref:Uncharacterized protein n=1 Tax=Rehmannia glutinosa TaxID=99300 RepID=A0ABR0XRT3_REHGL